MHLEDKILINCPSGRLYQLVSDVEGHSRLLPGYIESRIVSENKAPCIVQREAIINGQRRRWKSEVSFQPERSLAFQQIEGPLAGMQVLWELVPEGEMTWLKIIHDVNVRSWWKKWWMERWVAKPSIEKTARAVLEALKTSCESAGDARWPI